MIIKEKIRLIFFPFFCQRYKNRISADRFQRVPLFHLFKQKIVANAHFNTVFPNIGWFNRKIKNTVRFSIIKIRISNIFMQLRSKLTSEIRQKIGGLDGKQSKTVSQYLLSHPPPFFFFFLKKKPTVFIEKGKTLIDFSLHK